MIFGIYPGGMSGTPAGLTTGPANNPHQVAKALDMLQGNASAFLVRVYAGYYGPGKPVTIVPEDPSQYVTANRPLDLVLCFQSDNADLFHWKNFIRERVEKYREHLRYLQVTEEANANLPSLDGYFPASRKALVEGIVFARQLIDSMGLKIEVGFNATPDFNPNRQFWKEIRSLATPAFYDSLDYVGLDFFPDVFRPLPRDGEKVLAKEPIRQLIRHFRGDIADAGIRNNIPLHITENGWPTNSSRPESDQSAVLEAVIRAVSELRTELNIVSYEMFDLRDADSSLEDIFYRFGIMNDDYSPKQAFETYRLLIEELTVAS
ncbi:MAG: hypothetical protein WDO14_25090 [Bacteroidota bacterium]